MGDPKAHALFAPSASKRWISCPGSIKLGKKAPPQPEKPDAIRGTDLHWVAEKTLAGGIMLMACNLVGEAMPSGATFKQKDVKSVQVCVDYVRRHHYANGGHLYLEQRVEMPKIDKRFWGSADVIHITKARRCHVFDFKLGTWYVDEKKNYQGMSYSIGALAKYGKMVDLTKPVTFHICQPDAKESKEKCRSTEFSIAELIQFGKMARSAIKAADGKNPPLVDGEHCEFCPAEFICPKLNAIGRMVRI